MILNLTVTKNRKFVVYKLAIEAALFPSTKHLVMEMDGLSHLFQTANTGLMSEYSKNSETIAPQVLKEMSKWILKVAIK